MAAHSITLLRCGLPSSAVPAACPRALRSASPLVNLQHMHRLLPVWCHNKGLNTLPLCDCLSLPAACSASACEGQPVLHQVQVAGGASSRGSRRPCHSGYTGNASPPPPHTHTHTHTSVCELLAPDTLSLVSVRTQRRYYAVNCCIQQKSAQVMPVAYTRTQPVSTALTASGWQSLAEYTSRQLPRPCVQVSAVNLRSCFCSARAWRRSVCFF
jgi:hypothetical protein